MTHGDGHVAVFCFECGQNWPCDATRLLARLEAAEVVVADARVVHEQIVGKDYEAEFFVYEPLAKLGDDLAAFDHVVAGKGGAS